MVVPCSLEDCIFAVSFDKYEVPVSVILQVVLTILVPFYFHKNFRFGLLPISGKKKKPPRILFADHVEFSDQ